MGLESSAGFALSVRLLLHAGTSVCCHEKSSGSRLGLGREQRQIFRVGFKKSHPNEAGGPLLFDFLENILFCLVISDDPDVLWLAVT